MLEVVVAVGQVTGIGERSFPGEATDKKKAAAMQKYAQKFGYMQDCL